MLLRHKLTLITLVFFVLSAVGVSLALDRWAELRETELGSNVADHQGSLWQKIVNGQIVELAKASTKVSGNSAAIQALQAKDPDAVRDQMVETFLGLSDAGIIDRLEVLTNDGTVIYSSQATHFPTPIFGKSDIKRVAEGEVSQLSGLAVDITQGTMVVLALPLSDDQPAPGVAVLSAGIDNVLAEFATLTNGNVFLINRRGRYLAGTDRILWDAITQAESYDPRIAVQSRDLGDHSYWIAAGAVDGVTNPIGYVVSVKDVTESRERFESLEQKIYLFTTLFLLFATLALWFYMRFSLNPLTDAVGALRALSQGAFPPRQQVARGKDEIALIGGAIDRFRGELMQLARLTRSRHNRSKRQSRIIRRELTNLANTLDAKARENILHDLDDVEARVEAASDADEDTRSGIELAAIALTLTRLRERIQNQHEILANTILELEEALESKNAYVALQHELSIGTRVQLAMLPEDLPPTERLNICGQMVPAKEVGGDFYDFFHLDEDRLGLVIADVSGKGVPAALFMAISRSILRATAAAVDTPGACLAAVNDTLCGDNKEYLFVTVFYGILNLRTGKLVYANGGHNCPYRLPAGGGAPMQIPGTDGVALGVMEDLSYAESELQLDEGDTLYLYTDGVTEAINAEEKEYQEARLEAALSAGATMEVTDLLSHIVKDVQSFAGETPQADDITSIALRLKKISPA